MWLVEANRVTKSSHLYSRRMHGLNFERFTDLMYQTGQPEGTIRKIIGPNESVSRFGAVDLERGIAKQFHAALNGCPVRLRSLRP